MTKVLITNPPWTFRKGLFEKRKGVRAGSRWPFTGREPSFSYKVFSTARWLITNPPRVTAKRALAKLSADPKGLPSSRPYIPYPPFMGYAVSYLQSQGIDAIFYDAIALGHNYNTFYKTVDKFQPDIIIQETSTPSFNTDLAIANRLHKKYEVCLVGTHATAFAKQLIKLPFVDYILKGEYEYSSLEMVKTRRKGVYEPKRVTNLDDLPYPYRDEVIIHQYREYDCQKNLAFPQLWIYGGRGCAFRCDFCLWVHTMFNKKLTLRQPVKILDEVENMVAKYNFKYIEFDDDCWNLGGDKRLVEIADGLYKIGVPWSVLGRLDTCDKDTFKYLVDRGCVGLRLGVESLSQRLLDITNKHLKAKEIIDTINFLKTLEVSIKLCFMHYVAGETEADREEQERRIKEIGLPYQNPACIPFPGTPYYQKIVQEGFDPEKTVDWSEYDGGNIGPNLLNLILRYTQKIMIEEASRDI